MTKQEIIDMISKHQINDDKQMIEIFASLGLPSMTPNEIELIQEKLLDKGKDHGFDNPLRIFEYGTGHSTLYYSKFLSMNHIFNDWFSVDNDFKWHEKIDNLRTANIYLHLCEFHPSIKDGIIRPPQSPNEIAYINCPLDFMKFDVIFIDGRYRRRCLEVASRCLTYDGIVILHDAHRLHYRSGLQFYDGEIIESGKFHPGFIGDPQIFIGKAK